MSQFTTLTIRFLRNETNLGQDVTHSTDKRVAFKADESNAFKIINQSINY